MAIKTKMSVIDSMPAKNSPQNASRKLRFCFDVSGDVDVEFFFLAIVFLLFLFVAEIIFFASFKSFLFVTLDLVIF